MQVGDLVRLKTGSIFCPDHVTVGTVVRMPVEGPRKDDAMVMVQVGQDPRRRPVRLDQLEELGKKGTPIEEIQAALDARNKDRAKRAVELMAKIQESTK